MIPESQVQYVNQYKISMRKINYVGDLHVYKLQFINSIRVFYSPTDAQEYCLKKIY